MKRHKKCKKFIWQKQENGSSYCYGRRRGVADISKKFTNFLTVSRKFGYHCIYVFHVISSSTQIWQKIISQTNIFNIFPASVPQILFQKSYKVTA